MVLTQFQSHYVQCSYLATSVSFFIHESKQFKNSKTIEMRFWTFSTTELKFEILLLFFFSLFHIQWNLNTIELFLAHLISILCKCYRIYSVFGTKSKHQTMMIAQKHHGVFNYNYVESEAHRQTARNQSSKKKHPSRLTSGQRHTNILIHFIHFCVALLELNFPQTISDFSSFLFDIYFDWWYGMEAQRSGIITVCRVNIFKTYWS